MTSTSTSERPATLPSLPKVSPGTTPPVNISSQAYVDPACYVKGTNPLTIEAGAVIHPRCRLYTDNGKVTIGHGCLLFERCMIGYDKEFNPQRGSAMALDKPAGTGHTQSVSKDSNNIYIGASSHLHSAVKLQPPCTIGEYSILEAGVTLLPGCTLGSHSKICAGITLPPGSAVPDWTVVYGMNGQIKRKRQATPAEDTRLEGLARERQTIEALLKANATKTLSSSGGGSRGKRESVIRTQTIKE